MKTIKMMVDQMPKDAKQCPYARWDSEYGWICRIIATRCKLERLQECDCLIAPETYKRILFNEAFHNKQ